MHFLDLPVEILHLIANQAIECRETEGVFPTLFLSCKTLQNVLLPLLQKHNFVQNYRYFAYRRRIKSVNGWPIRTPWQLLYEISLQPQIAGIIKFADLRYSNEPNDSLPYADEEDETEFEWGDDEMAGYQQIDMMSAISTILEQSRYLSEAGCDWTQWLEEMRDQELHWRHGDRWDIDDHGSWGNVFLLSLLGEVESMVLPGDCLSTQYDAEAQLSQLLKQLIETCCVAGAPLSSLREILPAVIGGYDNRYALGSYQHILSHPYLEVATLGSCVAMDDGYTGRPLRLMVDVFPAIKELDLWECVIGADELYELVSRMPQLEIFKLHESVKYHGCGYTTFNPAGIVDALARTVGDRLRGLSLTADADLGGCVEMIRTFHDLTKLEDLEFTCDLVDTPYFQLTRTISRTIRRIRIKGQNTFQDPDAHAYARRLLDGFQARWPAILPYLEVVEVICPDVWCDPMDKPREQRKMLDNFRAIMEPHKKVTVLQEAGFKFMEHKMEWPKCFQPDYE